MLDWTTIITTLIGGGGIVGLFLITERKTSASVDNLRKQYDVLMELFEKQQLRHDQDLAKMSALYEEKASLREKLDDSRTLAAVNAILRCEKTACALREPPLGSNQQANETKNQKNNIQ